MLVNLKEILKIAEEKNIAIGAFNAPTLESLRAIIDASEELNLPVIINHAEVHEDYAPIEFIGEILVQKAKSAKIPVCVNLDHGESIDYIKTALDLGFSSVMYDGSTLSYEENVANTKKVVEMAREKNASVEGEIGILGGREGGGKELSLSDMYTDPCLAKDYCEKTQIDALACSFGTAHGFYKEKPKLDFERIVKIKELTDMPIVMHGGSGLSKEEFRRGIECGVRKINYYSYMSKAGVQAVKDMLNAEDVSYYHDLTTKAYEYMKKDVLEALKAFSFID